MKSIGISNEVSVGGRPIQILLADHLKLVRESVRHAIYDSTNDMDLIESESFEEATKCIQESENIKIVILALRLPGMNGLEAIREIHGYRSDLPIAIISAFYQYTDILKSFECGAIGFLSKEMTSSAIISSIRYMLSGERFVPTEVIETFRSVKRQLDISGHVSGLLDLSDREMEVMDLLMNGHNNKSIARTLTVEEVTIKMHVGNILHKLHAENRTHAAAIAFRAKCKNCPRAFNLSFRNLSQI